MRRGSRFDGRVAILVVAALAIAPLAFGGCGSSGGGDDTPAPGPLAVAASPAGANYSAIQSVALTATGEGSGDAIIYWTDDLSDPSDDTNAGRMEYTGPISVGDDDTVLKFLATPTTGDPTAIVLEGYTFESGIGADWAESGHGDIAAEAWRHWDFDDPAEVPTSCAKCHAEDGFADWADNGMVDAAAAPSMGLGCGGCHDGIPNTWYDNATEGDWLDQIVFPSGDTATLAGDDNICLACHQGRSSGPDVMAADPNDVIQDPDYESYSFINIHYYAAAASYFGNEVRGGYHYGSDENYVPRNTFPSHPDSLSTCVGCHMREDEGDHTWFPDLDRCLECHTGNNFTTLSGSPGANYTAIQTALTELLAEIQAYAITLGYPVIYDDHAYPYFFNDNGQGATYLNKYDHFDSTLLAAAYNYQFGEKEPCGYLHNGTYMRQLLHDSIVDLGGTPTDVPPGRIGYDDTGLSTFIKRTNEFHMSGHDDAGSDVFRHWDHEVPPQEVPASCAQCHGSPGFAQWALDGTVDSGFRPLSVVGCIACHEDDDLYSNTDTRYQSGLNTAMDPVPFPSGDTADLGNSSNVCMGCHQGRSSGPDVQTEIDASDVHTFINVHYYPAAASFFGADVRGGYEWPGETYAGAVSWPGAHSGDGFTTCTGCHMVGGSHTWEVELDDCSDCHGDVGFKEDFGGSAGANYTTIQDMLDDLYTAIQAYATGTIGTGIFYDDHAYPYFFKEGGAAEFLNRYDVFDDDLLAAAYNYQFGKKEPCGYIHNADYIMQILYDSIDALGGDVSGYTRP